MADVAARRGVGALGLSLATPLLAWAFARRLCDIKLAGPAAYMLLFLGREFCFYCYHRVAHRVRWFWATHAVHQSPNELSLATALRLGWTGKLSGTAIFCPADMAGRPAIGGGGGGQVALSVLAAYDLDTQAGCAGVDF